jgi:hypothetical protein
MATDQPLTTPDWGRRALAHAAPLAKTGRGSATPAEAQAAEYVRQQLNKLGIADVRLQPFQGLRSGWLFIALISGFALIGHAAFWLLWRPLGIFPALGVSLVAFGVAAYLGWRRFTFQPAPLQAALPHGPSQNVIAVLPPIDPARRKLVLIAHLDSQRAVFWFANDFLVSLFMVVSPAAIAGIAVAPLLYALADFSGLPVFAWGALVFASLHFLFWFTGMTADLGPYSPGANDNASGVGTLLSLAERLRREPLRHTEVWLAFTGCEETGCQGVRVLLDEHGAALEGALFLDFEMVGLGDQLVYLQSEGSIRQWRIPAWVEQLINEVGAGFGVQPVKTGAGAATEIGPVLKRGLAGVCLLAMRRQGPGRFKPNLPEWHRLTDTPDRLQAETLGRAHELGWALIQAFDVGQ